MDLLLEKAGSRRFYYRGEASVTEGKTMLPGTQMGAEAEPWAKEMWKAAAEAKVRGPWSSPGAPSIILESAFRGFGLVPMYVQRFFLAVQAEEHLNSFA